MSFTAIILAAGKGTRMKSQLPKVMHKIAGKPMLGWVIEAAQTAGASQILPVIGHGRELIENWLGDISAAHQEQQLGTGHAVLAAKAHIKDPHKPVIVLFGDTPLITSKTINTLLAKIQTGADICALGF